LADQVDKQSSLTAANFKKIINSTQASTLASHAKKTLISALEIFHCLCAGDVPLQCKTKILIKISSAF
jgi:hypothetical protein